MSFHLNYFKLNFYFSMHLHIYCWAQKSTDTTASEIPLAIIKERVKYN